VNQPCLPLGGDEPSLSTPAWRGSGGRSARARCRLLTCPPLFSVAASRCCCVAENFRAVLRLEPRIWPVYSCSCLICSAFATSVPGSAPSAMEPPPPRLESACRWRQLSCWLLAAGALHLLRRVWLDHPNARTPPPPAHAAGVGFVLVSCLLAFRWFSCSARPGRWWGS